MIRLSRRLAVHRPAGLHFISAIGRRPLLSVSITRFLVARDRQADKSELSLVSFASDDVILASVYRLVLGSPPRHGAHSAQRRPTQHGSAVSTRLRRVQRGPETRHDVRLSPRPLGVSSS